MAQRAGPPGTARIAVSGTVAGEPWTNVFWVNTVGGTQGNQTDFNTVVSNFGEAYYANLAPELASLTLIQLAQGTLFVDANRALHASHIMTHAGAQTGTISDNLSTCAVLSWVTDVYWRGGKPRTYLAGIMESFLTAGQHLTTAAVAGFQNAGNAFHTAINGLGAGTITQVQHGFVSFQSGGADRNPPLFFNISGCRVHQRIGTQRGRLGPWLA